MKTATVRLDRNFPIGHVDERLFGSFVEHLGRSVYTGIYEPDHPKADEDGFRRDVVELVKELGVPIVRYPGGNFVSGYDWEDGIGPRTERPRRLDLAWRSIETNRFGLNEFMQWCGKVETKPMMAINLGTGGLKQAVDILEYCNHPGGTRYSDLRKSHGFANPHDIKTWCLGNEMDGPWQIGHKSASRYGEIANEVGHAMKLVDPSIELIAAGSSTPHMKTFPEWEATVLDHCYEQVDYISLHCYLENHEDDIANFLAKSVTMDSFIETVAATCDYIKAKKRSSKQINISFDEWNVWFHSKESEKEICWEKPWQTAPRLLEDEYTFEDALVVGCMINTLIRHADRVKIGCMAQLVNVIAPIMTEPDGPSWRQTIFYPFLYALKLGRGVSIQLRIDSPVYESRDMGEILYLDTVVTLDEANGRLAIFAVNRSQDEELTAEYTLGGINVSPAGDHVCLAGYGLKEVNTLQQPDRVVPVRKKLEPGHFSDDGITLSFPPLSWNVVILTMT
jgi:alpha-L-arabinofuranosidase